MEHLREIVGFLGLADVRSQVGLSLFNDFENMTEFKPRPQNEKSLGELLDDMIRWGGALKAVREARKG